MMKKRHILILVMIGITAGVLFAQENYKEQYLELLRNNQFDELKNLLGKWEKAEPKNPEMFIGRLYATIKDNTKAKEYFNKVLEIGKTEEKEQAKYFIAQFQL
jgi:tetratricopeptide (TPR) repeat protein